MAVVHFIGKRHYIGYYTNEKDAAMSVNWKCKALGLEIKNPSLAVRFCESDKLNKKK